MKKARSSKTSRSVDTLTREAGDLITRTRNLLRTGEEYVREGKTILARTRP